MLEKFSDNLVNLVDEAGKRILSLFGNKSFTNKNDGTPITIADKISHEYIYKNLTEIFPSIKIISEEGERFNTLNEKVFFFG